MTQQNPEQVDPTIARLHDQKSYYGSASRRNRWMYKGIKIAEIASAIAITALAWSELGGHLVGWIGLGILFLEGLQQINHYHANWMRYRLALESLKTDEHLFLAGAGPYRNQDSPIKLLAERIEEIMEGERVVFERLAESGNSDSADLLRRAKRNLHL